MTVLSSIVDIISSRQLNVVSKIVKEATTSKVETISGSQTLRAQVCASPGFLRIHFHYPYIFLRYHQIIKYSIILLILQSMVVTWCYQNVIIVIFLPDVIARGFIKETIRNQVQELWWYAYNQNTLPLTSMQVMEPETLPSLPSQQSTTPGEPSPQDEPESEKNEAATLRLLGQMESLSGSQLDQSLPLLLGVFGQGQAALLAQKPTLLGNIMNHFVALSRGFEKHPSQQLQYKLFFALSLLAQYLRHAPKELLPMSGKFLQYLLSIECEDLPQGQRSKMAAILAMFYGNLARQPQVLLQHGLTKQFKTVLLENYEVMEGVGQRMVNQAILRLQTKKAVVFSMAELERYGVKARLLESLPGRQREMVELHMKQLFPLAASKKK